MTASKTTVFYNGIEITGDSFDVSIRRGRSRELDEFEAASGSITVRNYNRDFDPPFFSSPSYLLMETGDYLLLETGDRILLEQGSEASGAYGVIRLGVPIEVRDGAVVVFSGHVEDVRYKWGVDGTAEATFIVGDGLSTLARTSFQTEVESEGNQLPGVRIAEILDRSDVDYPSGGSYRSLANGHSRLIGDFVEAGTNVLQYLQLVTRTDFGRLYTTRTGLLVFKGRYDWPGESGGTYGNSSADFKDDGTAFSFSGVEVLWGSELQVFQASVTRDVVREFELPFDVIPPPPDYTLTEIPSQYDSSGTPRTATSALSPPLLIGARSVSISGLLLRHDGECEARAQYLVDRFSSPEAVVSELVVILENFGTTDRATIAALDINDVETLTWTPTGTGNMVTQILAIEGVTYQARTGSPTTITHQLSAMPDTNYFKLDTDLLDSGVLLGF